MPDQDLAFKEAQSPFLVFMILAAIGLAVITLLIYAIVLLSVGCCAV